MEILEVLITGIFTIGLLVAYAVIGFVVAMLIQLVSYQVFKFNIYKILIKIMEV